MGNLCSTPNATSEGRTDDNQVSPPPDSQQKQVQVLKLLLLGSGESGKSTFFKRLLIKYGNGYGDEDRREFIESIYENTIESMKTLIHQSKQQEEKHNCAMDPNVLEAAHRIEILPDDEYINPEIAADITLLWNDKGIRNTFELRSLFQVPDSAEYFFDHVHDLASNQYVPTDEHVLRCRDRTTGVTHELLLLHNRGFAADFDVYDVGGQRSERRHWVRIFQNVKTVLFVVAISEYDQTCFEDETTNRLEDALSVFKMVTNSKHFEDTPIVLLLNKTDLFRKKLESGVPFTFEGYTGPQDYDSVSSFIQSKFETQNETDKKIITRFVCAIDEDFNFDDVFKVVIENAK